MNAFLDYLSKPGAKAKLARALGITHAAVQQWQGRGHVPVERVLQVERITGIPREALRPDLYMRDPAPMPEQAA